MKTFVTFILFVLTGFHIQVITVYDRNTGGITFKKQPADFKKDTAIVNFYAREGLKIISNTELQAKAMEYIDSAVTVCEKKKIDAPPLLNLLQAEYGLWTDDLRSASEFANLALKKAESSGEAEALVRINMFFGEYNLRTGLYKESIESFNKSLLLAKEKGLTAFIPKIYYGEARVFISVKDINAFHKMLQSMINAAISTKDTLSISEGYYRLGTSLCGENASVSWRNFKQADSLLKICIKYSVAKKDTSRISLAYANSGWNFYLNNMYDSALVCYNNSLRWSKPGKRFGATTNSLGNIGTIYRDLGKYNLAIEYYKKAIESGKIKDDVYNLAWIYEDMSNLYLRRRDTSNAYKTFVLYNKYNIRTLIKSSTQGLADARVRYEADAHRKEVQLLSLRLKNNRILNYGFAGFTFLVITIGVLLSRNSRLKNKRRISEMNRKISEVTQANLRQQMNPHFIFNTLNSIQYYMYQNDKLATNNYLTKFSSLMRKVLDNSQHPSIPLADELNALKLYLELECIRFKDKFDFEIIVDDDIDPMMYKIPTMLIQPYVENSICHGLMPLEKKGYVKVEIKLKEEYLLCIIEDNGIGRDAAREMEQKNKSTHNSLGTQITASRLELVNTLYGTSLKTLYTDLKNSDGEPSGTRVEIHIPIIS